MAFTKLDLSNDTWTLIAGDVDSLTFQNASQYPFYINFNTSNTAPSEEIGLVYGPWQGELKRSVSDMTYKLNASHVFAKAITRSGKIIVETP